LAIFASYVLHEFVATSIDAPQHVRVDTSGSHTEGIKKVLQGDSSFTAGGKMMKFTDLICRKIYFQPV
jgi:hypothetical protein